MTKARENKLVRMCRVCHLQFTTNFPNQRTCSRKACQDEWRRIMMQVWRMNHPTYHRDYMRRYRRIGKEASHVTKGLIAYYSNKLSEAREEFTLAAESFMSAGHKLNIAEKRDLEMCRTRVAEITRQLERQAP